MPKSDPTTFGARLADAHAAMETAYRLGGLPAALSVYEGVREELVLLAESCGYNGYDATAVVYSRCRQKLLAMKRGGDG